MLGRRLRDCAYAPMVELLRYLESHGFSVFIASGGSRDFMRAITHELYAIPPERVVGSSNGLEYVDASVDHLIRTHYRDAGRAFRYCHARDIILQVKNHCAFLELKPELSIESIDAAVRNYFVTM